jgi:hypothetical protein
VLCLTCNLRKSNHLPSVSAQLTAGAVAPLRSILAGSLSRALRVRVFPMLPAPVQRLVHVLARVRRWHAQPRPYRAAFARLVLRTLAAVEQ